MMGKHSTGRGSFLVIGVLALLLVGAALAQLRPGNAQPAATPPTTSVAMPATATPTAPPTAAPTATAADQPYVVTVDQLAAVANRIELGVSVYDPREPTLTAGPPFFQRFEVSEAQLLVNGQPVPQQIYSIGVVWTSAAQGGRSVVGWRLAYDPTALAVTSPTLDVRLLATLDVAGAPPEQINLPFGIPTASPDPLTPHVPARIKLDRTIRLSFDPRRRIATPDLTVQDHGVAITLDRVLVTAAETRIELHGQLGAAQYPLLSGSGWQEQFVLGKDDSTFERGAAGGMIFRLEANLLDKPGPWLITLPETAALGADGLPLDPPARIGPWDFYFALPDISTALTPGPLPTLPPATPRPTATPTPVVDLPWLAQQADVIVRMKSERCEPFSQTICFAGPVLDWLKRPANLITDQVGFAVPSSGFSGKLPLVMALRAHDLDEMVVFLKYDGVHPWTSIPPYSLVDDVAAGFAITGGKISYPGLAPYAGMAVEDFLQQVRGLAPTPMPIPQPVRDLAMIGQYGAEVVQVSWPKTAPHSYNGPNGKRYLLNVPVSRWLRHPQSVPAAEYVGLSLTQEEYDLLAGGTGRYILFVGPGNAEDACADYALPSRNGVVLGTAGIFEIGANDTIVRGGVPAYNGATLQDFTAALDDAVPTPVAAPSEDQPTTLAEAVAQSQYIVEADLLTSEKAATGLHRLLTYRVHKWLTPLASGAADTLQVLQFSPSDTPDPCTGLTSNSTSILFLRDHKLGLNENPDPQRYDLAYRFDLRDGAVDYGSLPAYAGWDAARFEHEIAASIP